MSEEQKILRLSQSRFLAGGGGLLKLTGQRRLKPELAGLVSSQMFSLSFLSSLAPLSFSSSLVGVSPAFFFPPSSSVLHPLPLLIIKMNGLTSWTQSWRRMIPSFRLKPVYICLQRHLILVHETGPELTDIAHFTEA